MALGPKPAVWIVDPQTKTVSLKQVTIEGYEAGAVIVKQGLEPGERVVVDGGKLLSSWPARDLRRGVPHDEALNPDPEHPRTDPCGSGCKQETEAPEPVRPVLSTVVEPMRSNSTVAVGTVEPRYKTDLGFRLLGRLIARPVNVGDLVGEGDVVAAIDSTALEFAVRSARAELAKSQAQLANASATEERQTDADYHRRDDKSDAGQRRASPGRRRSISRSCAGEPDQGVGATRLCAAEI